MKKSILLFSLVWMFVSCNQGSTLEYKYQEQPQTVECMGADKALMHEALYSFQDDIDDYFKNKGTGEKNLAKAYATYIYRGTMGSLDFGMVSSKHTRDILTNLLAKNGDLFVKQNGKTVLNFNNEYVICLVDNIKNEDIKRIIKNLQLVNDMRVELLVEPYRRNVKDVHIDQNFAMLIALQTYYAHLADVDFSKMAENSKENKKNNANKKQNKTVKTK